MNNSFSDASIFQHGNLDIAKYFEKAKFLLNRKVLGFEVKMPFDTVLKKIQRAVVALKI